MMKKQMKHSIFAKGFAIVLSAALAFQLPYNTAFSAEEYEQTVQGAQPEEGRDEFSQPTGLCIHHTEHTAECGYTEGIPGSECTHEHTQECYEQVLVCGQEEHTHTRDCYEDRLICENEDAEHEHTQECYEQVLVCGQPEHTHTEECYEEQPTACVHVHDEECGYAEETATTECGYICYICKIQAMIDALPDPDEITEDNVEEIYMKLSDIDEKAAQYLTEEDMGSVDFSRFEACQAVVAEILELLQAPATQAAVQKLSGIQQIEINPGSLTSNTIWGLTETFSISNIRLDSWGAFYANASGRNGGEGGLPVNGYLTTPDGVEYHLATGSNASKAYDGNDSIRLESGNTTAKLDLETLGAYQNIYVLATAAGPGTGHYAIFSVRLDYTDNTHDERTYHLYDWYDGSATNQSGVTLYDNIYRIGRNGGYESEVKSGYGRAPFLFSAAISANPNKLLKSITFELKGTDTNSSSASGIYCGIYAITGRVSEKAPGIPAITAGAAYMHGFDVQWKDVSGATTYYMDIAQDSNFQTMLSGYNNQKLNLSNLTTDNVVAVTANGSAYTYASEEAVKNAVNSGSLTGLRYLVMKDVSGVITCKVEDEASLEEAKCYYVRLRAANNYGQSLSSNVEMVHTTGLPRWAYDAGFTDETASYDPVTGVLTVKKDITLTDTINLPDKTDVTIDLNSKTITAPAGEPAIRAAGDADVNLTVKDSHPDNPGKIISNDGQDNASGDAESGQPAIDFGNAGSGSTIRITDGTTIQGGNGGNATGSSGAGGNGGNGILGGNNTTVTVDKNANILGGNGGNGSENGNGGNGGDGASGSSVTVDQNASTVGGNGGNAGNNASAGNGGNGAVGNQGGVDVKDGASASGGNGGNAGNGGTGGNGGAGASSSNGNVSVDAGNATGGNGGDAEGNGTGGNGGNGASGSKVDNNGTTAGGNGGNAGSAGTEGSGGAGASQTTGTPSGSGSSEDGKEGANSDLPKWILDSGLRDDDVDYDAESNTLTLKRNVKLDKTLRIPENEKTTIDLNGFRMEAPQDAPAITGSGQNPQLEVKDTSGNGGSIAGSDGKDGSSNGGNGTNGTPAIDFSGSTGGDIRISAPAAVRGGNGGNGTGESGNGGNGASAIVGGEGTGVDIAGGASATGGNGGNAPFDGKSGSAGSGVNQSSGATTGDGSIASGENGYRTDPLPDWIKSAGLDEKDVSYDSGSNTLVFNKDTELDDTLVIPNSPATNIDLNGHDVTAPAQKPAIKAVGDGAKLSITDSSESGGGSITGGNGANETTGENGGNGAPAIDFSESTNSEINLGGNTDIRGGDGANGTGANGNGGNGGNGVLGGNSTKVTVDSGTRVTGGNGGTGIGSGSGGNGGNGVSGSTIINNGTTAGGNGGDAGSNGSGGNGGTGSHQTSGNPSGSGSSEDGKEGINSDLPKWILDSGLRDDDVDYDEESNTLTLKRNVKLDKTLRIPENEKTTIDLNGFRMEAPQDAPAITGSGQNPRLEVKDTSGNGGSIAGSDGKDGSSNGGNGTNGTPAIDFSGSTGGDIRISAPAAVKGGNGGNGTGESGNGGNGASAIVGGEGTGVDIAGGASATGGNGGNAPFDGKSGSAGSGVNQSSGATTGSGSVASGEDGNNTDPLPDWIRAAGLDEKDVSYDKDTNTLIFKKDVHLDDTIVIPNSPATNIDLNGHDVTAPAQKPAIKAVGDGAKLSITDSSESGGGSITGGNGANGNGGGNGGTGAPAIDFSESTNSGIHLSGNVTVKGGNGGNVSGGGNAGNGSNAIAGGADTDITMENGAGTQDGKTGVINETTTPEPSTGKSDAVPMPTVVPNNPKEADAENNHNGELNPGNPIPVDVIIQDKTAVVKDISIEQILQEEQNAKATGTNADHILIDLGQSTEDISKVSLPTQQLKELVSQAELGTLDMVGLTVILPDMKVVFSAEAFRAVISQATGDTLELVVDIEVRDVYAYEDLLAGRITWLNDVQMAAIADMQVEHGFEIYWVSNQIRIGDFRGGIARLYVPYEISQDKQADLYTVYYVSREGELQAFETTYEENSLVFDAGHFSDFVIAYNGTVTSNAAGSSDYDHEPKTGDEAMPVATLTMIAGFLYLAELFREHKIGITEEQKDRLIQAIIRHAKGRSYPVRMLALGLIFVLLVFYHSIGKRVEANIEELSF